MMIQMRDKAATSVEPISKGGELSCEEFQAQIPDLMGGDIHRHEHLKTCQRCTALIEELEYIAEIAKGFLPAQEPPDSLWKKIQVSIQDGDTEASQNGHAPESTRGE